MIFCALKCSLAYQAHSRDVARIVAVEYSIDKGSLSLPSLHLSNERHETKGLERDYRGSMRDYMGMRR